MTSILRDQRIGRILRARGGNRPLHQAESGGTREDNRRRLASWRNRYNSIPVEMTIDSRFANCEQNGKG